MKFNQGDWVVYHKFKHSSHPGPRAEDVRPATRGETYAYAVDKYWRVTEVTEGKTVQVITRTGKVHDLQVDDPCLRKATLLERVFLRHRFPPSEHHPTEGGAQHAG